MRQVGSLPSEQQAQRFADFLQSEGIAVLAEADGEEWAIWVRDENQVDEATSQLETFRAAPDDARYRDARRKAEEIRREEQKRRERAERNTVVMRQRWSRPSWQRRPLTMVVIVLCVLVALLTEFGKAPRPSPGEAPSFAIQVQDKLLFVNPVDYLKTGNFYISIEQGEIWRLFTPNFLHLGPMHLIMNMLMFSYLGGMIEERRGTLVLGALLLILSAPPFIGEYMATGAFLAMGISGTVYGLFGYLWMKSAFDPTSGIQIPPNLVIIMLVWLALGAAGVISKYFGINVANWAHGVGLVVGMAAGYLPVLVRDMFKR